MLQQHLKHASDLIRAPKGFERFRKTVGALLIMPDGGLLLVQHANGPFGSFIPPQGGIKENESPSTALRREIKEELPDLKLNMRSVCLLGDAINEMPPERSDGPDKWQFWLAVRCLNVPRVLGPEIEDTAIVYNSEALQAMLTCDGVRRRKRDMVCAAVRRSYELGMLPWGGGHNAQGSNERVIAAA